jgi:hypothetical protein
MAGCFFPSFHCSNIPFFPPRYGSSVQATALSGTLRYPNRGTARSAERSKDVHRKDTKIFGTGYTEYTEKPRDLFFLKSRTADFRKSRCQRDRCRRRSSPCSRSDGLLFLFRAHFPEKGKFFISVSSVYPVPKTCLCLSLCPLCLCGKCLYLSFCNLHFEICILH